MNNNVIFDEVYSGLQHYINELTLENVADIKKSVDTLFKILMELTDLPEVKTNSNSLPPLTISSEEPSIDVTLQSSKINEIHSNVYTFERKLNGGFLLLPEKNNIFISEIIVRHLGIEHGDRVKPILKDTSINPPQYHFEIVEKANNPGDAPQRVQVSFAIVKKVAGELFAEPTNTHLLPEDKRYEVFKIPLSDINRFSIEEGDIIDFAYYESKPQNLKVIWIHQIDETSHQTPLASSAYKSKEGKKTEKTHESINLNGTKVLLVGGEYRKAIFREKIENANGIFEIIEGNFEKVRFSSAIKRVDFVAIMTSHISHRFYWDAVELCKQYNKPFIVRDTLGINSLLEEVHSALNTQQVI